MTRVAIEVRRPHFQSLERRELLTALPVGGEFRVNFATELLQRNASIAMDNSGNFIVAWQSQAMGLDEEGYGIYARRYNAAGLPQGGDFRVNTYTTKNQWFPAVAIDADGDFVIAWESEEQDQSRDGVYAQRFNASGARQGPEFRVNNTTPWEQRDPAIAMDDSGEFVIAWESNGHDGPGLGVWARRYNAAGVAQGNEFRVNTYTTNDQSNCAVGMDAAGAFVITWDSFPQDDGSSKGVYAQRYNAAGVPQGGEFLVNTFTTDTQFVPAIAMSEDGAFVIAWNGFGGDTDRRLYARRYDAGGVAQGAQFGVETSAYGGVPSIAMDAEGGFVITWSSGSGLDIDVYARSFDSSGNPLGEEHRVNTYLTSNQLGPAVAMDPGGNFVIVWQSLNQPGGSGGYDLYGQRYAIPAPPHVLESRFDVDRLPQTLVFRFDQDVSSSLSLDDVRVQAIPSGVEVTPGAVTFDAAMNTASVTLTGILADGRYRATLSGAGIHGPSGAPMAADHTFDFFFLNGDANRDGTVNLQDFNRLAANFGQSNRTFSQGDFNYDGVVNLQDFNILAIQFGKTLVPGGTLSLSDDRTVSSSDDEDEDLSGVL